MITPFVLDKPAILERLGGDEEIYSMMLDMFLQDVDNNCAALQAAAAGDPMLLQREAHTVKGLLATFSDDAGAALAFSLEQQAKAGRQADATSLIAAVVARVGEVAGVLRGQSAG